MERFSLFFRLHGLSVFLTVPGRILVVRPGTVRWDFGGSRYLKFSSLFLGLFNCAIFICENKSAPRWAGGVTSGVLTGLFNGLAVAFYSSFEYIFFHGLFLNSQEFNYYQFQFYFFLFKISVLFFFLVFFYSIIALYFLCY